VYVACDVSCEVFWGFRMRGMRFASCTEIPEVKPRKLVAFGVRDEGREARACSRVTWHLYVPPTYIKYGVLPNRLIYPHGTLPTTQILLLWLPGLPKMGRECL